MLWHAMPPELNTARLMAGAGPAPMLQAAAGWEALAGALETQALELSAALVSLKASWTGMSSERAIAATMPMVAWLQTAAQQAQQRAARAAAQAASYTKALAMTPSLPEIATNHITHAVLTATNFLGINMVPIGLNETDYFVRMWNQAAAVMDIYQVETIANTTFEPLPPIKPILQPGVGEAVATEALSTLSAVGSEAIPTAMRALSEVEDEIPETVPEVEVPLEQPAMPSLGQLGQLGGPMQQLMQPLQQLTSMAGQSGGMGGPGDSLVGDKLGHLPGKDGGQVGLVGASPLSTHPLAGGSGPSVGMGLMRSEALPGAGGTAARTSLMNQLLDRPSQVMAPAGAGAGSSAAGGAAPVGMGGSAAQSAAATRPGLASPALLASRLDDAEDVDFEHEDDW
ncbi:PPE family protein [Mycobacterium sp. SMC-2]|uniref:PPE family protein n=1 Tax=Mycobacterium sp. SMC-2 TaxID=2857058 RepID=UPI0021B31653|nr:PPE family protein [Mycobacterium sp. SMC-2]UXA07122.1 PPE family protein [Mycobacterium sp. SMC-2]